MNNNYNYKSNLKVIIGIFVLLLIVGTLGFSLVSGRSVWDAFYLTVTILLTHFHHEVKEPVFGKILTLILIFGSFIIVAYLVKWLAEYIFEGELKGSIKRRKMDKKLGKMTDHYIICGFGRVGSQIAEELAEEEVSFVVIDRDPMVAQELEKKKYIYIEGDPTYEENLEKAGIRNAKGLIAALGEDTDNLFVVLAAKSLNPGVYVVARASRKESKSKLKKAGADRVAMPYNIGGYHMATMALRPAVVDFLDVIVDGKHKELQVEEIEVSKDSNFLGKTIGSCLSRKKTGTTVLAVNKSNGVSKINPSGDEVIEAGDRLIIMGGKDQLEKINEVTS